jgi:hypothetical protein
VGVDGAAWRPASRRSSSSDPQLRRSAVRNTGRLRQRVSGRRGARRCPPVRARRSGCCGRPKTLCRAPTACWTSRSRARRARRRRRPPSCQPTAPARCPRAPGCVLCVRRLPRKRQSRPARLQPVAGVSAPHALPASRRRRRQRWGRPASPSTAQQAPLTRARTRPAAHALNAPGSRSRPCGAACVPGRLVRPRQRPARALRPCSAAGRGWLTGRRARAARRARAGRPRRARPAAGLARPRARRRAAGGARAAPGARGRPGRGPALAAARRAAPLGTRRRLGPRATQRRAWPAPAWPVEGGSPRAAG